MSAIFVVLLILAILVGFFWYVAEDLVGLIAHERMLEELWDAPSEPRLSAADKRQRRESRPANDLGSHRARKVGGASRRPFNWDTDAA